MPGQIHSTSTFDPVRVEITSPGTLRDGQRFYTVDFVETDGGRACMWDGTDPAEARQAARECADDGKGGTLPVLDLATTVPGEIATGTVH